MIEDDVMHRSSAAAVGAEGVGSADGAIAWANSEMLNHHVVGFDGQSSSNQSDSGIGRRLTRDGQIWISHGQRLALEIDDTAHLENNESRPPILESLPEGTRAVCVER